MLNTIEETIKLAGWGRRKAIRKQIELFEKNLLDDEKLLGVATSKPNPTEQLYITNKRIIVHKIEGMLQNNKVEIPLSSINSINTNVKGLSSEIIIVTSNNTASVEKIPLHVAQEIKKLLDSLILKNQAN
ncbi:hypothetical protein COK59_02065 [Bacillus thuringiensis]|uniref:PH domain-containing protein n=1 Tax=Bacillus thuringiensis TaxID=1428 RepID=UPI000BF5A175|nr:PH domain-containing protein [Bacillus thuringiensis]MCU4837379.1 PH domain-containing protein [Bacillus cereus]PFT11581.1 hypothetical protein COK59_02065 [Bacillus thuringiensis]